MKKFLLLTVSLLSFTFTQGQQKNIVDFKQLSGTLTFTPQSKSIQGQVSYAFKILSKTDSIYLDGKEMRIKLVKDSPLQANLKSIDDKIWIYHHFKPGQTYTLQFEYETISPKQALYFVGQADSLQIWSQGQGKETSYWLPSLDDPNDKMQFNLTYRIPKGFIAIGNGTLIKHHSDNDYEHYNYQIKNPMSSYLVGVAIGKYDVDRKVSSSNIPLELYYLPKDSLKAAPTYRYTREIMDFLEHEIGVNYPWENYKMVPVRDFLYAGMENTTNTIFAESLMIDSIGYEDRNFVSVNAHEIAHQWFGDYVTEASTSDHWLQEGFATYYALLAERKILGDDHYFFELFQKAEQLKSASDKGKGESLLNPKAGSQTFYDKGAWALVILHEQLGDENFKKTVKTYLKKHAFSNAKVSDFIEVAEKVSGQNLSDFKQDWLEQSAFKASQALDYLKSSSFIRTYMETSALGKVDFDDKKEILSERLDFPINSYIGQEVIHQLAAEEPSAEVNILLQKAFDSNDLKTRQAIAESFSTIPKTLKSEFESLLKDRSYRTQEAALFLLWNTFPENQSNYLQQLKHTTGFSDLNIRILWLTLSLATPNYLPHKKQDFFQELSQYTAVGYDYSIRQNAFSRLYQLDVFDRQNYFDLMEASVHPVWRFRKFARELLEELLKKPQHKNEFEAIEKDIPIKQQKVLEKRL